MENEESNKPKNYTWLIIVLAIILLALVGLIVWMNLDNNKTDDSTSSNTITDTNTVTSNTASTNTAASSTTTTTNTDDSANTAAARAVAINFLNAWSERSLADAKAYMTTSFYGASNQADFAGVSSPSRARFTITSTTTVTNGSKYTVVARCYQNLSGEEIGYTDNTLDVEKVGNSFLVNAMTEGSFTEK